jgi:hypothetical protein
MYASFSASCRKRQASSLCSPEQPRNGFDLDKLLGFFESPRMKMTIPQFLIALLLVCIGLAPKAQAVNPPPDGGYPGGNTAEGQNALLTLSSGTYNTAVGLFSLLSNTTGSFNTALGAGTLLANTADQNTATGAGALLGNTTGFNNTATGAFALFGNTEGSSNTATGNSALQNNTSGANNTAIGAGALLSNTTGFNNNAVGTSALEDNSTGSNNTSLGDRAGGSVTTASNVICIGASVFGEDVSDSCYIGSIFGQVSSGGAGVFINSAGKLGTATSSRRFKDGIKPMDKASEVILALKPVTFRYKKGIDPQGSPQFGLVAEEVEAVNPDLVVRDKQGKVNTVRYDQVNAMLLNEFLKEHKKVEEMNSKVAKQEAIIAQQQREFRATVTRQENEIQALTANLKEQAAQIQKVSARIEMNKPATKLAGASH